MRVLLIEDACGGDSCIDTVWGRGYVLREPQAVALAA